MWCIGKMENEVQQMLENLMSFGEKEAYFEFKKIKDFDDAKKQGISMIERKAIDFDKTKNKVCREHNLEGYKSCDCT